MTNTGKPFDVVILGGGPAGCAAAIVLARAGMRTAVVERSRYDAPRIGETLPPSAVPQLHRLAVWEAFARDQHVPSPGIVSVWGSERPVENDFIFNPFGDGWHLDRKKFDSMLAESAERAGALLLTKARMRVCERTSIGQWHVHVQCDGRETELAAGWLMDATGRTAWLAQRQGACRQTLDQLVGVVGIGRGSAPADPRTLLEASRDGWWYSAGLPNGEIVAVYMTDADLLPRGSKELRPFFRDRFREAPLTSDAFRPADALELRTVSASTSILDRLTGPNWLAVGDAASTCDPLSSQGICKALESGYHAASAVIDANNGTPYVLGEYARLIRQDFADYLVHYRHYYAQVTRWPESPFWKRRQARPANEHNASIMSSAQPSMP